MNETGDRTTPCQMALPLRHRLDHRRWLLLLCLISICTPLPLWADAADDWFDLAAGGDYFAADRDELQTAEQLFGESLAGRFDRAAWSAAGFEVVDGGRYWWIREREGERRGRGSWWIARQGGSSLALIAPHRFKDLHSGDIALALAQSGDYAVVAWNSVPRSYRRAGEMIDADLAHLAASWHTALAAAFARYQPHGRLIQLHGFAAEKRNSAAGAASAVIVSAGHRRPGKGLLDLAACLGRSGVGEVRHYPQQVSELGGTTNRIGARLREVGFDGFVHLELSLPVRRRLLEEPLLQHAFNVCIATGVAEGRS